MVVSAMMRQRQNSKRETKKDGVCSDELTGVVWRQSRKEEVSDRYGVLKGDAGEVAEMLSRLSDTANPASLQPVACTSSL